MNSNYKILQDLAYKESASLFGVAYIKNIRNEFLLPKEIKEKFEFAISFGFRLSKPIIDTLIDRPNQFYYFHYQRVNQLLDNIALKLTSYIQSKGYQALPIPASQVIDWQNLKGTVSHRKIANLAGLGWIGKNNLLINFKFGAQVRYATILTDIPLDADKPFLENRCGNCKECIRICPAKAISEYTFNIAACIEKLREFMKTEKIGQMICGLCVKACSGESK